MAFGGSLMFYTTKQKQKNKNPVYFSGISIVKISPIGSYLQTRIITSLSKKSACLIANDVLGNRIWLI